MRFVKTLLLGLLLTPGSAVMAGHPDRAADGEARLAKIVDGRIAGQPVNCIDLSQIDTSEVVDGTAIVYHDGNRLYVNRPETGSNWLDNDDILVTKTWSSHLCSIDTVRLVDRTSRFERGFVALGEFVPYSKPSRTSSGSVSEKAL